MTGKERLEEIKMKVDNTSEPMMYVPYGDIDWLIEQAERVQELEAENERLRTRRDHLAHRLKIRREENQRYKEVKRKLEAIYDVEDAEHPIPNEYIGGYLNGLDRAIDLLEEAQEGESE